MFVEHSEWAGKGSLRKESADGGASLQGSSSGSCLIARKGGRAAVMDSPGDYWPHWGSSMLMAKQKVEVVCRERWRSQAGLLAVPCLCILLWAEQVSLALTVGLQLRQATGPQGSSLLDNRVQRIGLCPQSLLSSLSLFLCLCVRVSMCVRVSHVCVSVFVCVCLCTCLPSQLPFLRVFGKLLSLLLRAGRGKGIRV